MKKTFFLLFTSLLLFFTGCSTPVPAGKKVKKTYFTGGQVSSKFFMDDDTEQNGLLERYGYNGKITSRVRIHNGVKDGVEIGYDTKGRVIWKYTFINGRKHGQQYAYYPNGDVMISYNYSHGIKNGIARTYNVDGTINEQVFYDHGRLVR